MACMFGLFLVVKNHIPGYVKGVWERRALRMFDLRERNKKGLEKISYLRVTKFALRQLREGKMAEALGRSGINWEEWSEFQNGRDRWSSRRSWEESIEVDREENGPEKMDSVCDFGRVQ